MRHIHPLSNHPTSRLSADVGVVGADNVRQHDVASPSAAPPPLGQVPLPRADELAEITRRLDELCVTRELLAFVAGVGPSTVTAVIEGRRTTAITRYLLRVTLNLLVLVLDPNADDDEVDQAIDGLDDKAQRDVQPRKRLLRALRASVEHGRLTPPTVVWARLRVGTVAPEQGRARLTLAP
ncbi:MAG: hypothetical protein ACYDEA_06420 [Candidatus Dormibacteria bacterium]